MKRIEFTVRPDKFNDVREALRIAGIHDITMSKPRVNGCAERQLVAVCADDLRLEAAGGTRLEMVVSACRAEEVIGIFAGPAWSGLIADGKLVVYEVPDPNRLQRAEPNPYVR